MTTTRRPRWGGGSLIAVAQFIIFYVMPLSAAAPPHATMASPHHDEMSGLPLPSKRRHDSHEPRAHIFIDERGYPVYHPRPDGIKTKFIIISTARSATNGLVSVLDANNKVQCFYEAFNVDGVFALEWDKKLTTERRDANRTAFMERIFTEKNPSKPKTRAQGFKIMPWQLTRREYLALARSPHIKKIVIRRQDAVAQFVSNEIGNLTRYWSPVDEKKGGVVRFTFDMRRYRVRQAIFDEWFDFAHAVSREQPSKWLFLTAEEVISDKYALMKIYDHLRIRRGMGMVYHPYEEGKVSLADKIINYDEVKDTLGLPPR